MYAPPNEILAVFPRRERAVFSRRKDGEGEEGEVGEGKRSLTLSLSLPSTFMAFFFFYSLLQSKPSRLRVPILSEREERRGKGGDGR